LAVAWDQWNHRNQIAHKTLHLWKLEQIEILNDKIQVEYSLGIEELSPLPKRFFWRPLATTLKLDELTKQRWLESMDNARQMAFNPAPIPPTDPTLNLAWRLMREWLESSTQDS
jgi:hypothetical protein